MHGTRGEVCKEPNVEFFLISVFIFFFLIFFPQILPNFANFSKSHIKNYRIKKLKGLGEKTRRYVKKQLINSSPYKGHTQGSIIQ